MELKARVDREEALAFLGHRGQELGDLRERLERAACLCEKELVPRGVYREMDASEALALLPGLDIARHVGGCTRVVLLAVTLGTQSEMLLRRERALSATDACSWMPAHRHSWNRRPMCWTGISWKRPRREVWPPLRASAPAMATCR